MKSSLVPMLCSFVFVASIGFGLNAQPLGGTTAPDFTLVDTSGTTHTLSYYRGKTVLINFFATWCAECRYEMSQLKKLFDRYAPRGLVVLGIDVKEKKDKVLRFQQKHGITWPVLLDGKAFCPPLYRLRGFPFNVVVDASGTIVYAGSTLPLELDALLSPRPLERPATE
jgi:peroxiredoxin